MFLKEFNEIQKECFWSLALLVVRADGQISKEEEKMLQEYKIEMNRDDLSIRTCSDSIENIVNKMGLTKRQKKILLFELIGLALSDESFDYSEEEVIEEVRVKIDISVEEVSKIIEYAKNILSLYVELGDFINE